MEKFDVRDDGAALEKSSLRQCARRVIRLSDCVSVGPAGTESCPKATAAFYLTTTEKSYVLAAEQRDEWIAQLCQLAFQVPRGPAPPGLLTLLLAWVSPGLRRPWAGRELVLPPAPGLRSHPSVPGCEGDSAEQRQDPAQPHCPHGGELPLLLLAGPYVRGSGMGPSGLWLGAAVLTPPPCSASAVTEFPVLVLQTDAAARCGLHGHYLLAALPQSLTLKDPQSRQPLLTWPYPFLRKFGQDQVGAPLPPWGC